MVRRHRSKSLREAYGVSKQSLAVVEPLSQSHVQTRIEHEPFATRLLGVGAGHGKQFGALAMTPEFLIHDQIVDKDKSPAQQIFLQTITDDPDNSALTPCG